MVSRRGVVLGLGAVAVAGGCAARMGMADDPGSAPPVPAPRSVALDTGLTVHAIQTGWVSVKRAHRAFRGPDALALPAIVASIRWTPWLPVIAWVIEHPDGMIVVDTGETARMVTDPDYPSCDGSGGWFYRNQLRFAVTPEQEIGAQMRGLGLDPDAVGTVVMTHLHSDHIGGMGQFANARFQVSRGDAGGHAGALLCRLPQRERIDARGHDGPAVDAFAASRAITKDGAILAVPTPGHTPAHQSVLVRGGGRSWLIAGDAAFDDGQVDRGETAGIAEDRDAARRTLDVLRHQRDQYGTAILPSHDPDAPARLAA